MREVVVMAITSLLASIVFAKVSKFKSSQGA